MTQPHRDVELLKRNLECLGVRSRRAIDAVLGSAAREDVEFGSAPDGGVTLCVGEGAEKRQLTSKRAPMEEARRLAETVDFKKHAAVVVLGFGAGHHIAELARGMRRTGLIVVFEPDAGLLRAVFERVDCTPWLSVANVVILTQARDRGAISEITGGFEGVLASGTVFLSHPPSAARLGEGAGEFERAFTSVMQAVRTVVLTTLVQVDTTVRNLLQNVGPYSRCPGIADLANSARGRPAVVVSAGPSLRRNIELLSGPGVRDRVVIIAVQTVLKTLLARGIRPHYVTALDYHEISKRFYEGLTPADVEGVTLVVEPKANPAIIDAFPGRVRMVSDQLLDDILGEGLARPMGKIKPGATVAHLAYYLARHLGCDPVVLVGQDLGFTDDQYYAPGAAIHRVWSGELNEFNTIEMLEWQRIVRMRSLLRRVPAQQSGDIYTDEQMATYLVQFERDFLDDTARGMRVIDATEGGVLKKHTTVMTLREALAMTPPTPFAPPAPPEDIEDPARAVRVRERVRALRSEVGAMKKISEETKDLLGRMLESGADDARINALISRVHMNASKVAALGTAHRLVQFINQAGQLNRFRSDRAIELDPSLAPKERQRLQIERDLKNVTWLADAAAHTERMLDDCERSLGGAPKVTRDTDTARAVDGDTPPVKRVAAIVTVDTAYSGLNTARDLFAPVREGAHALDVVLEKLVACKEIDAVLVVCRDREVLRPLLNVREGFELVEVPAALWDVHARHRRSVGAARATARHCWRGGIANLTCYDEAMCPEIVGQVLATRGFDAAAIVGADWCLLDEELLARTVSRYRENPARHAVTFSQAPAGKGVAVIAADIVSEMAVVRGANATLGGLLAYHPFAPQADPIAKPQCVQIDAALRDSLVRYIPDSAARLAMTREILAGGGVTAPTPELFTLSLAPTARPPLSAHVYARFFAALAQTLEDSAVNIDATEGDARLARLLVELACSEGTACVQLVVSHDAPDALFGASADVTSVLFGEDASEWASTRMMERLRSLSPLEAKQMPAHWFVPHIARGVASIAGIEKWYDYWLRGRGAAVITPAPAREGSRLEPMPMPENVIAHRAMTRFTVSRCGLVRRGDGVVGDLSKESMLAIFDRLGVVPCEGGRLLESETAERGAESVR